LSFFAQYFIADAVASSFAHQFKKRSGFSSIQYMIRRNIG